MAPLTENKHLETVGLDVDGAFLAAAVVDGRFDPAGGQRRTWRPAWRWTARCVDPDALTAALKDLFRTFKLPKRVRLGVANQQIVVRQLEMPLIEDDAERDAAVRFQAAEAIAMPLDEAILDYQPIGVTKATTAWCASACWWWPPAPR